MSHYQRQMLLAATTATVYHALTTPDGLRDWWTATCDIATKVGGKSTFRFNETYKVMQIESLVPSREVRWHCVEACLEAHGVQRKDEWVGTHIVFRLSPQPEGKTLLDFEHIGLTPALECFAMCEGGWNLFLGSLQNLVETGRGTPFVVGAACTA